MFFTLGIFNTEGIKNNNNRISIAPYSRTCDIPDIAVNLDSSHLLRKDRSSGGGGGVAAYTSGNINCHELLVENVDNFEILWTILRPKELPLSCLILAAVYCPSDYDAFTMKKLSFFHCYLMR